MRALLGLLFVVVIAAVIAIMTGFIDLDASGGKLPEIRADAGRMPDVDVKTGEIDVGSRNETVTVPTLDVKTADEK